MATELKSKVEDRYVTVDGLRTRYIEAGQGPAVIFLHGASLGSSADVFIRNLGPFASEGFRAIAFDQPGFGLSDAPTDHSVAYRRKMMPKFIDALGLRKVALVAHSQSGNPAVQLALQEPERYSHIVVLGTGSLLPPLDDKKQGEGREAAVQQRLERRMAQSEPSIEDTKKLLEANLFHHELITPDELALRHSRSLGKNFEAFVARNAAAEEAKKKPKEAGTPIWQRLTELKTPLLMIFGKNDRANAYERCLLLKEKYPRINLHIVDGCKHLVPWDAADEVVRLTVSFLKS
jgi:4,5:9,10-diseco-3-hydroxy-5,9,17-trioxoandrosta-1(10),2-diene-4-oate hydrolase